MTDTTLVLILGDQLSRTISSLAGQRKDRTVILMAEVHDEATYVRHHKKKIAFVLSAMRHFADEQQAHGWTVDYIKLDATGNTGSLRGEVERALARHTVSKIRVTEPGEYRLMADMRRWSEAFDVPVEIVQDRRFVASHGEFEDWARGRDALRMEYFYREMRKKTGLLMRDGAPEGGRWNFDQENRKPAKAETNFPDIARFEPDETTREVIALVGERFADHFGDLEPFWFAVSRSEAETALQSFLENALASFGDYQDAMLSGQRFLYHSVLSLYINVGLLDPLDVCRRACEVYEAGLAPLNAVEGFVRQIIGWREFVRGIYWLRMPEYADLNQLAANRPLPGFYWTGETDMQCLKEAITQTKEEAYAHHIQRLMVTGNFAMLAGVTPREISEWYLIVYADAFEWVELPNVIGMSQFADGGVFASKPYAAGGNYIAKMSNYCDACRYDVRKKTGDGACPFNSLYWHFLDRNRDLLGNNARLRTVYSAWDRMDGERRSDYLETADRFLSSLS